MVRLEGQLALDLDGRCYDLRLERNDLRAPGYTRQLIVDGRAVPGTPTPVSTYRGKLAGDPTSVVRLSMRSDHLGGYIRTAGVWLWLEPLAQLVEGADPGRIVAYLDTDVRPDPDAVCGTSHLQQVASDLGLPPVGTAAAAVAGGLPRWELVTEADGEYFQDYGDPGTFDRILDIVNEIDGIYNDEEGLRVTVPFQQAWANPQTDPYTSNDAFPRSISSSTGGTIRATAGTIGAGTWCTCGRGRTSSPGSPGSPMSAWSDLGAAPRLTALLGIAWGKPKAGTAR